ncbi:MAG TPA: DUF992 domain-containing protein [Dongiaceae bacterium]|nr:DUF992 domain-containing protein [Dongiaceae bacterium]
MVSLSRRLIAVTALAGATMLASAVTQGAQQGVKAGYLRCEVAGSISFIFGSTRDISCTYETSGSHRIDKYTGEIKQYGIDIGYLKSGVMIWGVVAPTNDVGPGALAGDYGGINGTLAAGYGVGANALLGGYKDSIALQPLSVEGVKGFNIAAAVVGLTLKPAQ